MCRLYVQCHIHIKHWFTSFQTIIAIRDWSSWWKNGAFKNFKFLNLFKVLKLVGFDFGKFVQILKIFGPKFLQLDELNCFCGMVDRRKAFSLISSRDHCQRSSPSRICDTPRIFFEQKIYFLIYKYLKLGMKLSLDQFLFKPMVQKPVHFGLIWVTYVFRHEWETKFFN